MVKKFYEATEESGLTVIVVNQEYQNIQTMGYGAPTKVLRGGSALRYGKSISMEVKKSYSEAKATIEKRNGLDVVTESFVTYTAKKNKLGAPMRTTATLLNIDPSKKGTFNYVQDVISYGSNLGFIEKNGAWFTMYDLDGVEKKYNGNAKLEVALENDIDLYSTIKLRIYSKIYEPFEYFYHFNNLKEKIAIENRLLKEKKKEEIYFMEGLSAEDKTNAYAVLEKPLDFSTQTIDLFLSELKIEESVKTLKKFYDESLVDEIKSKNLNQTKTKKSTNKKEDKGA